MAIKVGDRIRRCVTTDRPSEADRISYGTVIYVHPQGRFYTVQFNGGKLFADRRNEHFYESYRMIDKEIKNDIS